MRKGLTKYQEIVNVLENLRVAVKEVRRYKENSLRDVSQQSGVSFNSISRFERGGDIPLSAAIKLLRWLGTNEKKIN